MKSLKLNRINKSQLNKEQMSNVYGGSQVCGCGCCYSGSGGSSTDDNGMANANDGLRSPDCSNTIFVIQSR